MIFSKRIALILPAIMLFSPFGMCNTDSNVSAGGCFSCCKSENDRKCNLYKNLYDAIISDNVDLVKSCIGKLKKLGENYFLDVTVTWDSGESIDYDFLEYMTSHKVTYPIPDLLLDDLNADDRAKERLTQVNENGENILHIAIKSHTIGSTLADLAKRQEYSDFEVKPWNQQDKVGNTPLHLAVLHNDRSAARALVVRTSETIRNEQGKTPHELAREQRSYDMLRIFSPEEADAQRNANIRRLQGQFDRQEEAIKSRKKEAERHQRQKEKRERQQIAALAAAIAVSTNDNSDSDTD